MFDMDRFTDRLAGRLSGGMKQKLSLACALVPQPRCCCSMSRPPASIPVSRREFWDTLAHLAADGLTIVVATPYLDEAERCHRVALMHLGEIHEIGTPPSCATSLHAKRLEVRTDDLGRSRRQFLRSIAQEARLVDVQRFGDRLDIMVSDPEQGREPPWKNSSRSRACRLNEIRVERADARKYLRRHTARVGPGNARAAISRPPSDHRDLQGRSPSAPRISRSASALSAPSTTSACRVRYGEIYGLLGANGAGKTTTIKMLCGLLEPTPARCSSPARAAACARQQVRQRIGYMSQKFSLYDDLTIDENLDFFAGVYGVPEDEREEKKRWVLAFSGLEGKEDQITGSLPGGWKQRVAFGAAIMHEPSVLFLDEPTSGVDPLARRAFWRMINKLADTGTAILVTTHYLEEAEQCNRLGFMVAGELVAEGTPQRREERAGRTPARVHRGPAAEGRRPAEERNRDAGAYRCSATACT